VHAQIVDVLQDEAEPALLEQRGDVHEHAVPFHPNPGGQHLQKRGCGAGKAHQTAGALKLRDQHRGRRQLRLPLDRDPDGERGKK